MFLLATLLITIKLAHSHTDAENHNTWEYLDVTLPKGVSDMTATYHDSKIYIFGGCDSGNTRADFDPNLFICTEVSDEGFVFDPSDASFALTQAMPQTRYRHSAAILDGKIYLVGGRDVEDNIITDVDVYDIATNSWSTSFQLEAIMAKSDFGMFANDNSLYMVGGYDKDYTASNSTYKLNLGTLGVEELGNLVESRGDIHAEIVGDKAVVTGGFTHENGFCQAKNSTEIFDLSTNEWTQLDDMNIHRGDQAVVSLDNLLFVIGGEYKIKCSGDPAESTTPSDEVDVLDLSATSSWRKLDEIPDNRFRFQGEAFPPTDTIYIFGGQKYYDVDCDCYAVSDKVLAYHVHMEDLQEEIGAAAMGDSGAFDVNAMSFAVFTIVSTAFMLSLV